MEPDWVDSRLAPAKTRAGTFTAFHHEGALPHFTGVASASLADAVRGGRGPICEVVALFRGARGAARAGRCMFAAADSSARDARVSTAPRLKVIRPAGDAIEGPIRPHIVAR